MMKQQHSHHRFTFTLMLLVLCCLHAVHSLNRIEVKGNLLFDSVTKQQFWVKGVDYQPKNDQGMNYDVLADFATIQRDLPYLQQLGINAIRVYEVSADANHDQAMAALEQAGIYLILDVPNPEPGRSIEQENPAWNLDLFRLFKAKIDAFSGYSNLLAFIASNEVSNQVTNTDASAYVKAAIRDTKAYLKSIGKNIPVGYAIADDGSIVLAQQEYFACGSEAERPDFYGINIYRWCGESTFEQSGYSTLVEQFTNWPIPVIFSEYGCNQVSPRPFTEVGAIYGSNMTSVFSGGLVFEYSQEVNLFGLVDVNGQTVTIREDFNNLKTQLAAINPQGTTLDAYNPSLKTVQCPAVDPAKWQASSVLPPTTSEEICNCAMSKVECRAKANTTAELDGAEVGTIYSTICTDPSLCAPIATDAMNGVYGQYSMCDGVTRVSLVMNDYYIAQGKAADACDWEGFGQVVVPTTSDCSLPTSNTQTNTGSSSTSNTQTNTRTRTSAASSTTETESDSFPEEEGSAAYAMTASVLTTSLAIMLLI